MNRTVRHGFSKRKRGSRFWINGKLCCTRTNLEKKKYLRSQAVVVNSDQCHEISNTLLNPKLALLLGHEENPVLTTAIMLEKKLFACDTQIMRLNKISIMNRIHKCLFCTGFRTNIFFTQYFIQFWETEALWKTVRGNSNCLRRTLILQQNSKITPLKKGGVNTRRYSLS
jgi:hypothetical protein